MNDQGGFYFGRFSIYIYWRFWYIYTLRGFRTIFGMKYFGPFLGPRGSHFVLKIRFWENRHKPKLKHQKSHLNSPKCSKMLRLIKISVFKCYNRIKNVILTISYVRGSKLIKTVKNCRVALFLDILGPWNHVKGDRFCLKWLYRIKFGVLNY